ncbi:MAG: sarcosine oxidase subunit delta [Albidovulum sp.]|nr:sarcosine oxidase subunit delta [Albidovulum sp.]
MLEICCPFCGRRNESEFSYGGPAAMRRPERPEDLSAEDWVEYLTVPSNPLGPVLEHWWHARGCGAWITVRRDTGTHEIKPDSDDA